MAQQVKQLRNQILSERNISKDSIIAEYNYAYKGFAVKVRGQKLQALKNDPRIARVTPNALFKLQYQVTNKNQAKKRNTTTTGQSTTWGITRVGGPLDGTGKKAWILDTGIDLDHSDLNVDVDNSASFIAEESADDQVGHGTHVAGILAAKNNSSDVVGVAAGATVVAVKVCNSLPANDPESGCPVSSIINGVNFVSIKATPEDIINMSLGGISSITDVDDAVIDAANSGLRFTISAGNDAIDANNFTPARVEHPNVWTVSAFRQGDEFVQTFDYQTPNCNPVQDPNSGSNFGNPPIEYAAPGENILSLWKGGGTLTTCGTSMAAPHIAGLLLTKPNDISTDGFVSNDPDGDPDPIAAYTPFTVTISGPNFVNHGEPNTWTAQVENAPGPVSYAWFVSDDSNGFSFSWTSTGVTSQNFTWTFFNDTNQIQPRGIKVLVSSGSETREATQFISVGPGADGCQPGEIICL